MTGSDCKLCSFHAECHPETLWIFAGFELLGQVTSAALDRAQIRYARDGKIFQVDLTGAGSGAAARLSESLGAAERRDLRAGFGPFESLLGGESLERVLRRLQSAWFDEALRQDRFTTYFQPIVDVSAGKVFGHECLIRLEQGRLFNGGEILDAARERGKMHHFDAYARQLAIRKAHGRSLPGMLFVNFQPSSIYNPDFCMKSTMATLESTGYGPRDIVFEVVESDDIQDASHLQRIVDFYKSNHFGFALDDLGTGSNSLQLAAHLRPDLVKIDKSLIQSLDNPSIAVTVRKIVEMGQECGFDVIAEGIETLAMIRQAREAGVRLMQGYYLGRPAADPGITAADLLKLAEALGASTPVTAPLVPDGLRRDGQK